MGDLVHGKVMHMINQKDYDLLQSVKNGKYGNAASTASEGLSEEEQIKKHNDDFLRGEKEIKFKEDEEWRKVEKRLSPIIHPDSTKGDIIEIVEDVTSVLPASFKGKGKMLLTRLAKEDGIKIDRKHIYINEKPLDENISDIVDQLVRPKKLLALNLDELLNYLKNANFPKTLIANAEALRKLGSSSTLAFGNVSAIAPVVRSKVSTPKSSRKRSRRKQNNDDGEEESTLEGTSFQSPQSRFINSLQAGNGKGGSWCHY